MLAVSGCKKIIPFKGGYFIALLCIMKSHLVTVEMQKYKIYSKDAFTGPVFFPTLLTRG